MTRAVFVVNPASAGGRSARVFERVAAAAAARGIEADGRFTRAPGDATEIARGALREGARLLVAVGGDGTISEVANGFFDDGEPVAPEAELAIVPSGTGSDLVRTLPVPRQPLRALEVVASGTAVPLDVIRIRLRGLDGEERVRISVNAAGAGSTGAVAERVNRSRSRLPATVVYAWAGVSTFARYRNVRYDIDLDAAHRELVANTLVIANARALGGGMRVAPEASPHDGLLDVLVIGDVSLLDLARKLPGLYFGRLRHPRVERFRARRIEVVTAVPQLVQADGEIAGTTPALFEVLPGALRVRLPATRR